MVLCTNTMHKVAAVIRTLSVPLLRIGDVTAAAVLMRG